MKRAAENGMVEELLRRGQWSKARSILRREQGKDPNNHWVLTQLGVTFYEQRQYDQALTLFLESQQIVPECPLTLWNIAGALDALGEPAKAVRVYTWLLRSHKSPDDDPCWESKEWTELLKADCIFRLGVCFQHLNKKRKAEACYREYLNLVAKGIDGSYSVDDVKQKMRGLQESRREANTDKELRKAVKAALQTATVPGRKDRVNGPPAFQVRLPPSTVKD